jgi:hypothetical protein
MFIKSERFRHILTINALFVVFIAGSIFFMTDTHFGDDQLSYVSISESVLGLNGNKVVWQPTITFSYFLAAIRWLSGDMVTALKILYFLVAFCYLNAMYWCLGYFFRDKRIRFFVSIISIVPQYTLAMTFWGFAGFQYLVARILFMPLAPIVLRLFFQWRRGKLIWVPFVLAALGGLLSFEAFYLLAILFVFSFLLVCYERSLRSIQKEYFIGLFCSIVILLLIYYYGAIAFVFHVEKPIDELASVYQRIVETNSDALSGLSAKNYADTLWEASYKAFWWGLFPPALSDILFALFNASIVLFFASFGLRYQRKENPELFQMTILFIFSVLCVSYGYQIVRYISWKLFLSGPSIYEEVRAFKFIFFVLYLFVGSYLLHEMRVGKRALVGVSVVLLLVSPLGLARSLPMQAKKAISQNAQKLFRGMESDEYIAKALSITNNDAARDLGALNAILRALPQDVFILSDNHQLTRSGKNIIITYHDKRSHTIILGKKRFEAVLYWYYAYQEIERAFKSRDMEQIQNLARKYGAEYVVVDFPIYDFHFESRYKGKAYFLYRVAVKDKKMPI